MFKCIYVVSHIAKSSVVCDNRKVLMCQKDLQCRY